MCADAASGPCAAACITSTDTSTRSSCIQGLHTLKSGTRVPQFTPWRVVQGFHTISMPAAHR
eukprot:366006-Chlamydomonas_euryale.AAC.9